MKLQSKAAPSCSSSSLMSPSCRLQMNIEQLLPPPPSPTAAACEKLQQQTCQGDLRKSSAASLFMDNPPKFPKLSFPTFKSSSSNKSSIGIGLTTDMFPSTSNTILPPEKSSCSSYFSPNKIAYYNTTNTNGSNDLGGGIRALPFGFVSPRTSGPSNLQDLLHRCGLSSSSSCDQKHKSRFNLPNHPSLPSHITQKIKNLDEILQNLDHYSISKRLSSPARKDSGKDSKQDHGNEGSKQERDSRVHDLEGEHDNSVSNLALGSGLSALRSEIPDGITFVNKSLSRMEFKTQMEKLTDLIEDRWVKPKSKSLRGVVGTEQGEGDSRVSCLHHAQAVVPSPNPEASTQDHQQDVQEFPSTPKPTNIPQQNGFNDSAVHLMQKMMKRVIAIEHLFARRQHRSRSRQARHKEILSRGRFWVHRPIGKRMFAMFQKQLKRYASTINQRLDKTDLAINSLRGQRQTSPSCKFKDTTLNVQKQCKRRMSPTLSQSSSCKMCTDHRQGKENDNDANSQGLIFGNDKISCKALNFEESKQQSIVEKCMLVCDTLSQDIQHIQDQLCTLQNNSHNMGQTLETIRKQSKEQNMELELCWTAINHLCIDSETYRDELHIFQSGMQHDMQRLQGLLLPSSFRDHIMENASICISKEQKHNVMRMGAQQQ